MESVFRHSTHGSPRCYDTGIWSFVLYMSCELVSLFVQPEGNQWADIRFSEIDCRAIHYNDVTMGTIASQITSLTIVCSNVYSDEDKKSHSSSSLAFVLGIHRWPVKSPHKGPVTQSMFSFDDVSMYSFGPWQNYLSFCRQIQIYLPKLQPLVLWFIFHDCW